MKCTTRCCYSLYGKNPVSKKNTQHEVLDAMLKHCWAATEKEVTQAKAETEKQAAAHQDELAVLNKNHKEALLQLSGQGWAPLEPVTRNLSSMVST